MVYWFDWHILFLYLHTLHSIMSQAKALRVYSFLECSFLIFLSDRAQYLDSWCYMSFVWCIVNPIFHSAHFVSEPSGLISLSGTDSTGVIFQTPFSNLFSWEMIQNLCDLVPTGLFDIKPMLIEIMTWRLIGTKPLSEQMMAHIT